MWSEKPFTPGQAWIDLLLLAAFDDCKIKTEQDFITIKRGQTLTSVRNLSHQWGWGNGRVLRFLNLLKKDNMILIEKTSRGSIITIVNYEKYQKIPGEVSETH